MATHFAHHKAAKWVKTALIIFASSAVGIPLIAGLIAHSYLWAAVAFSVWTSLFTVTLGIIFSQRTANEQMRFTPQKVHLTGGASPRAEKRPPANNDASMDAWIAYRNEEGAAPRPGSHLPNGWLLPQHVTLRPTPPPEVALAAGVQVIRAAWTGFGLALAGGLLAFSAYGSSSTTATVIGLMGVEIAAYNFALLLFTRHSVRGGMPRPLLDRPSLILGTYLPLLTIGFGVVGGLFDQLSGWNTQIDLGFLAVVASMGANAWWFIATAQRWNLTYAAVDSEWSWGRGNQAPNGEEWPD